jgi:hypothetical protein
VTVDKGVARLNGTAPSLVDSRTAEKLGRKEAKEVVNQVLVEPAPRADKEMLKDAERAVLSYPYYGVLDAVGVDVDKGLRPCGVGSCSPGTAAASRTAWRAWPGSGR